jgi:hypothetical protein
MTVLTMADKQRQMTRLIRAYISQFDTALTERAWDDIHRLSREVNRLAQVIGKSVHYKKSAQAEVIALHLALQKVHHQATEHKQALCTKLDSFHHDKEGLRAYHEVQGWE